MARFDNRSLNPFSKTPDNISHAFDRKAILNKLKREVVEELEDAENLKGSDGRDGIDGRDGVDGRDGRSGIDARPPIDGRDGIDGEDGKDGDDGEDADTPIELDVKDHVLQLMLRSGKTLEADLPSADKRDVALGGVFAQRERHVNLQNFRDVIYIKGAENIDGSIRLLPDPQEDGDSQFEKRVEGEWVLAGLNVSSLGETIVFIRVADDFGPITDGLYDLINGTTYVLDALVFIENGFRIPPDGQIILTSTSEWVNSLVYFGTGTVFNAADLGRLMVREIFIFGGLTFFGGGPASTATCFDISSTQGRITITAADCAFVDFDDMGTINDVISMAWDIPDFRLFNKGLKFNNIDDMTFGGGRMEQFLTAESTSLLTFTGSCGLVTIFNMVFIPNTSSFVFKFDNALTAESVVVVNNAFSEDDGAFFDPAGSDQTKDKFTFINNGDGPNSVSAGELKMIGNTTETVISATTTPVLVAGTTISGFLERFTATNQTLTYAASRPIAARVRAECRIEITGVNEGDEIATFIFIDGVKETITEDSQVLGSAIGTPTSPIVSSTGFIQLVTGDTIQVFIENRTETNNLKVTHLDLTVEAIE